MSSPCSGRRHRLGLPLVLLVSTVLLLGCGPRAPNDPVSATATIPLAADLTSVNELLASNSQVTSDLLRRQLFATLLEEQADFASHPPTFAPGLAETWEWSPDRRSLQMRLREARWSDGTPISAADVRFTWQAQTSPAIGWDQAFSKETIENVEIIDARTVRFRFSRVSFTQLADVNEGVILPHHLWAALKFEDWRQQPTWFREHLVTSGPFLLERWTEQQEIVLRRNPDYFRPGLPKLDQVVFKILPDRESQILQAQAGQLDFVEGPSVREADRLERSGHFELQRYWSRQYNYIGWNTRRPWLAEARVRRALTLATDRQELVDVLAPGLYRVATSPIPSSVWAHDASLRPLPFDPARARRELEAAGFADRDGDGILERDGKPLRIELATNASSPLRVDATLLLARQMRHAGIDLRPAAVDFNLLLARLDRGEFDAVLMAWGIDTSLDVSFAFESGAQQNWGGFSDPTLDTLLESFRQASDIEDVRRIVHRVEARIDELQPYTFLWEAQRQDAVHRRLRNARPDALSAFANLREWEVARP